ncbi:MAG TPA: carboxypeptidase-like regulatory domain-containing protein, partial [Gemmatimonadales bacterium]
MARPRLAALVGPRLLLILAIVGAPAPGHGQSEAATLQLAAIAGTVSDVATHEPLADVRILLEGTKLGAASGIDGRYRIVAVPPGAYVLSARRLGYVRATEHVAVPDSGTVTVDFALEKSATTLDEIVVTGTPQEQTRRPLGNALGKVRVSDVVEVAPPPNVQ